ncbi:MAG: type II toxin-antitoxin system HicA family toxin [Pirellulales bacterium]|nr:type II toxin-antitoxin system HicA family toxin [Pirellulales bacterium]
MPNLPAVNGKQAIRAFERLGFSVVRIDGSHHIMKKPGHCYVLTVPVHSGRVLPNGTLRGLIRAASIAPEEFAKLVD